MKPTFILTLVLGLLLKLPNSVSGQGLLTNLDFESASVPMVPLGQQGSDVLASEGLPGWHAYYGSNETVVVRHNLVSVGSVNVAIFGPNAHPSEILQGEYTVLLQAGRAIDGLSHASAAISQEGSVPADAKSITFRTSTFPYPAPLEVSFSLQPLAMVPLSTNADYLVFGADVSQFAGQLGDLRFEVPFQQSLASFSVSVDDIQFSSQPIPEPGALALFGAGGLALVWRFRRKWARPLPQPPPPLP